ncbi:SRPBCC family protein [Halocatena halophila]|uniref:SRPBCC family protein n=1 Tax=Halocatena halophila TaxID=2814576 RepID=UPI002ED24B73
MTTPDADDTTEIETSERSLTIRRTFDASRERVWRAFTDADELEQWFVPEGMEATVHANELEAGGAMAITWTDGEHTIENDGVYTEVVDYERLGTREEIEDGELRLTYEFSDAGNGAVVVLTQEFPEPLPDGVVEGWTKMLDTLEERL